MYRETSSEYVLAVSEHDIKYCNNAMKYFFFTNFLLTRNREWTIIAQAAAAATRRGEYEKKSTFH